MEAASLAVGIIGLAGVFKTCLEAANAIQSYLSFDPDFHTLDTQLNVARLRFEQWGQYVGFDEQGAVDTRHHSALDNQKVREAVSALFQLIKTICETNDAPSKPSPPADPAISVSSSAHFYSLQNFSSQSKRKKLAWSLWGKDQRKDQVKLFREIVQELYNLIPPEAGPARMDIGPGESLAGRTVSETAENMVPSGKLLEIISGVEKQIHDFRKAVTRKDVQHWLLDGQSSTVDIFDDAILKKVDKTCNWIFEETEFKFWFSSEFPQGQRKVLWITGPPGFGKTVLSANIIQYILAIKSTPVAYFFFSSDQKGRDDPFIAIRVWISQLIAHNQDAFELTSQRWQEDPDLILTRSNSIALLRDLLRMISRPVYLIIDGLDECVCSEKMSQFLSATLEAIKFSNTSFLIVSRQDTAIREGLTAGFLAGWIHELEMTAKNTKDDILLYTKAIVVRKLANKPPEFQDEFSQLVADKSQGSFLWLKLHEESLRQGMNNKQLNKIIERSPPGLNRLFDKTWKKITQRGEDKVARAMSLLRWVTYAWRPLTIGELTEAVVINDECDDFPIDDLPDSIDMEYVQNEVLGLCAPLLELRCWPFQLGNRTVGHLDIGTVHLTHFTVREYLLAQLPSSSWICETKLLGASQIQIQNTILAKACLDYLKCSLPWEGTPGRQCFRGYAAVTWKAHFKSGLEACLNTAVIQFLERKRHFIQSREIKMPSEDYCSVEEVELELPNPIFCAVAFDLPSVLGALLEDGCYDPNEKNSLGMAPLDIACLFGNIKATAMLTSVKADVIIQQRGGIIPLHLAARIMNGDIARMLLNKGADCNAVDNGGRTPLHVAVLCGSTEVIKILVQAGANLEVKAQNGLSPLGLACFIGDIDAVNVLLAEGADMDTKGNQDETLLYIGASQGHSEVVRELLQRGADGEVKTKYSAATPIHAAAHYGHVDVVAVLIENGTNINTRGHKEETPLMVAAREGHSEVVKKLLELGAEIEARSCPGLTALHYASKNGNTEVVKVLLDKGANLESETDAGLTPLGKASLYGHLNTVKLLLDRSARPNVMDRIHRTPLNLAIASGNIDVIRMLCGKGTEPEVGVNMMLSPLHIACFAAKPAVANLLLEKGVEIEAKAFDLFTPLQIASASGNCAMVNMLLDKGADLETKSGTQQTALLIASIAGQVEIVRSLLNRGADFIVEDKDGWTPLNVAAKDDDIEMITLLCQLGANPNAPNRSGFSAFHYACIQNNTKAAKRLHEYGANIELPPSEPSGLQVLPFTAWLGWGWIFKKEEFNLVHLQVDEKKYSVGLEDIGTIRKIFELIYLFEKEQMAIPFQACNNLKPEVAALSHINMSLKGVAVWNERPLNRAAGLGHHDFVELLLNLGAKASAISEWGSSPLHAASENGHEEVVRLLLSRLDGAGVIEGDRNHHTALYLASRRGHYGVVKIILEDGRSSRGKPVKDALLTAVMHGDFRVAKLFLSIVGVRGILLPSFEVRSSLLSLTGQIVFLIMLRLFGFL